MKKFLITGVLGMGLACAQGIQTPISYSNLPSNAKMLSPGTYLIPNYDGKGHNIIVTLSNDSSNTTSTASNFVTVTPKSDNATTASAINTPVTPVNQPAPLTIPSNTANKNAPGVSKPPQATNPSTAKTTPPASIELPSTQVTTQAPITLPLPKPNVQAATQSPVLPAITLPAPTATQAPVTLPLPKPNAQVATPTTAELQNLPLPQAPQNATALPKPQDNSSNSTIKNPIATQPTAQPTATINSTTPDISTKNMSGNSNPSASKPNIHIISDAEASALTKITAISKSNLTTTPKVTVSPKVIVPPKVPSTTTIVTPNTNAADTSTPAVVLPNVVIPSNSGLESQDPRKTFNSIPPLITQTKSSSQPSSSTPTKPSTPSVSGSLNIATTPTPPPVMKSVLLNVPTLGKVQKNTLPAWLKAQMFSAGTDEPGGLTIGYSFGNDDSEHSVQTDPNKLKVTQNGLTVQGRLDRRNTSEQVGVLKPHTGEFGTITLQNVKPGDINLTWDMQDESGTNYTYTMTWNVTAGRN